MKITANGLTKSRFYLALLEASLLYVGSLWLTGGPWLFVLAIVTQLIAEYTDIRDGQVAREEGTDDGMGQLLDPAADAFLHGMIFLMLVSLGWVSVWLASIFFARESAVAYYRLDLALHKIKLKAKIIGKIKTVSQAAAQIATIVFFTASSFGLMSAKTSYCLASVFIAVSACITVYSFFEYRRHYLQAKRQFS